MHRGLRFWKAPTPVEEEGGGRMMAPALKNAGKGLLSFRPLSSLRVQGAYDSEDSSFSAGDSSPASSSLEGSQIGSESDEECVIEEGLQAEGESFAPQGIGYQLQWYAWQPVEHSLDPWASSTPVSSNKTDIAISGGSSSLVTTGALIACVQRALKFPAGTPLSAQQLLHVLMSSLSPGACCLSAPIQPIAYKEQAVQEAAAGAARSCFQELQLSGALYCPRSLARVSLLPQLVRHVSITGEQQLHLQKEEPHGPFLIPAGGRVMISGGLGSLGLLIATWLTDQHKVQHILLLARSARSASSASNHLSQLWQGPAQAVVAACDAGCVEDVRASLAPSSHQPPLSAVLHAGGVLADATLRNQSLTGLRKVIGAKVAGLPHLLGAAQLQPGAHHVLFSSVASLLGAPGQANYSAANAALDAAASTWQHAGLPTVSVQWGAWAGGGMAASDASTAARVERSGMSLIEPKQGLAALEGALSATAGPPVVAAVPFIWSTLLSLAQAGHTATEPHSLTVPSLFSEFEDLRTAPLTSKQHGSMSSAAQAQQPVDSADLTSKVDEIVREAAYGVLGREDVGLEEPLMSAGLDSLGAVELRNSLESRLAIALPTTLIFDYPTLSSLQHFLGTKVSEQQHQQQLTHPRGKGRAHQVVRSAAKLPPAVPGGASLQKPAAIQVSSIVQRSPPVPWAAGSISAAQAFADPGAERAAAAGMPGDTIGAVPMERWDIEQGGGSKPGPSRSTEARFGAFMPDASLFDAQAFGISEAEAILMDPQQRLLLECSAEAMAAPSATLPPAGKGLGKSSARSVGAYVGVASSDYGSVVKDHTQGGAFHATANALSVIAGRVSYTFNLEGPSLSVDTACSAALVALHLGMCAVSGSHVGSALVAGVHVQAAPTSTSYVAAANMLSPNGRCMVLDEKADGYVRGEGAAALMLQEYNPQDPQSNQAGAIFLAEGSAVNQDGRSSSLTAPNGNAQQSVVWAALEAAGVRASDLDMVSMHGTGTSLGDPVEIAALSAIYMAGAQI